MAVPNLLSIQQNMIRYGMAIYVALGIIGNICNCIIFTKSTYRRTSSSTYFLSLSIISIIYLIWSTFPLFYTLDHQDLQTQSLFYCKTRLYVGHCLGQCMRYIVVFACIDRYIITRVNVHIRSLSSVQMAMKIVYIIIIVYFIISIHIPILMDIRGGVCGMFSLYKLIYAIYQITLAGILPPLLMIIFSALTIRSLQYRHGTQRRAKQRDRYLLRMVIAEVMVNVFTSVPYSANLVYGAAIYYVVGESSARLEIETFITFITQFLIYLIAVAPFYLFILTAKPFRNEFINLLFKFWNRYIGRHVRIIPLNE
ncbi:unnamed protein product [Adineta steineri]|uniref:G-protein coupled receptors family 1 profile domain-containing protein n=3 Tax=Adineta steineri TaxID=433720 RepID=A0A818W192_9BILA|nr:unnamed protein product [Adineta steineri]